jgi:cobalt/nickel transport system permease protein
MHPHRHDPTRNASPTGAHLATPSASRDTDARIPLVAVLLAIAAIGSEPLGELPPFVFYLPLTMLLPRLAEGSLLAPWRRILPVLPVLALLGAGFPLSRWLDGWLGGWLGESAASLPIPDAAWAAGVSLFLRALCALLLLSTLVHSVGFVRILRAMRALGLPAAVVLTLEQMERYRGVLAEEWRRSQFARQARSPGALAFSFSGYANQTSLVFLRSWERSERVHAAMLARGFRLDQPGREQHGFNQHGGDTTATPRGFLRPLLRWFWLPILAILIRLTV